MKKKTKIILWISGGLAGILLLLAAAAGIIAAKVIDSEVRTSKTKVNMLALLSSASKIRKAVQNAQDTNTEQTIFLTDNEFNAQANSFARFKRTGLVRTQLTLDHGVFSFYGTKEISSTPFGKYVNFQADFLFEIQQGVLKIYLKKVYAGTQELPLSLCERELEKQLKLHFYGTPYEKMLKKSKISCSTDSRGILLTFSPNVLKNALPFLGGRP